MFLRQPHRCSLDAFVEGVALGACTGVDNRFSDAALLVYTGIVSRGGLHVIAVRMRLDSFCLLQVLSAEDAKVRKVVEQSRKGAYE